MDIRKISKQEKINALWERAFNKKELKTLSLKELNKLYKFEFGL